MANNQKHGLNDGSAIFFLIKPFRWVMTIVLVTSSLTAIAIASLMYFCTKKEMLTLASLYAKPNISYIGIEQRLGANIYRFLHWLLFDITHVQKFILRSYNPTDLNAKLQNVVVQNYDQVIKLEAALQVISMRIGLLVSYSCTILIVVSALAFYDGLMSREIRTACLGRESSTLYHQAKFLRTGSVIFTCILFFSWPNYLDPVWLILFGSIFSVFIWVQAKFYKKYV